MAPRPRLDSETELARHDVRLGALEESAEKGEREHERLQEDYGRVMAALANLDGDLKVIKSKLEGAEKSNVTGPSVVGVTVILAQALAEVIKYFVHLH